jgi:putative ABC transport system permease protein
LFLIVSRSLRQHALSTLITVVSVALACGLLMAVFALKTQTHNAFTGGDVGFDAVLGARGSQLQLVLNTVFHLETSPGNIPWELYKTVQKEPHVELAVPYAVGDNYKGFRIVGTSDEMFTKFQYQSGKTFQIQPGGRLFESHPLPRQEAVIGSFVAQKTGLGVGKTFNPYHGFYYDEQNRHAEEYLVTGVLEPTNTPSDRVIWIPIEGIFRMSGHVLRGSGRDYEASPEEAIPDEDKEVSAVMLKFSSPQAGMGFDQRINKQGNRATLAWPIARIMADLFDKIGWMDKILELVAYLVVLVASGSILASIYNTMNERRREFAIMRALGARRGTVFSAIVLESSTIALLGSLAGFLVYAAILAGAAAVIRAQTGVVLDVFSPHPVFIYAPLGLVLLGALSGIVPAMKAYGTDVASNLSPVS